MRCDECRFWSSDLLRDNFADCRAIDDEHNAHGKNVLAFAQATSSTREEMGWLVTRADFGCVLFEPRTPTEEIQK